MDALNSLKILEKISLSGQADRLPCHSAKKGG